MEFITKSTQETHEAGAKLGRDLKTGKIKKRILAFYGELGSGKTTFIQGLAKGLGIERRLISPTFVFVRRYEKEKGFLYHVDLYRLKRASEARGLDLPDFFADQESFVLLEWADKIKEILPKERIDIFLEYLDEGRRKITIKGC